MRVIAFDCESFLIQGGLVAPELVCLSWADGAATGLLNHIEGPRWLEQQLDDPEVVLVAHNAPFDAAVCIRADQGQKGAESQLLRKVIRAYDEGRLRDTIVRQKLYDISRGSHKFYSANGKATKTEYDLASLVKRRLNRILPKQDTWRLRYGELFGIDPALWPAAAREYAIRDAVETLALFLDQCTDYELDPGEEFPGAYPDEFPQERAQFALHLMSMWGLRADPAAVELLAEQAISIRDEAYEVLLRTGLARWEGVKNPKVVKTKAAAQAMVVEIYEGADLEVPYTDPSDKFPMGQVSLDAETLGLFAQRAEDDDKKPIIGFWDERCEALLEIAGPILSTWVPALRAAARRPLNPRYNVLVETGRTSCSKGKGDNAGVNIQNPPRKGAVRECIRPRGGRVFIACDYSSIEMATWAQACLDICGFSHLALALQKGEDPHSSYAAFMLRISYEEMLERLASGDIEAKEARQNAKVGNFGRPGGLGDATYVSYAKGYGLNITLAQAKADKVMFYGRYPEARPYFDFVAVQTEADAPVVQLRSGRVRGRVRYTARANGYFQGLAADGAKAAMWAVTKECYLGIDTIGDLAGGLSPLYGSRPTMYIHDEIIMETPEAQCDVAARRLQQAMEAFMQPFIPDIPAKASPTVMRNWFKGAEPVQVDGKYVPGKPVKTVVDGKKKVKWVHDEGSRAA